MDTESASVNATGEWAEATLRFLSRGANAIRHQARRLFSAEYHTTKRNVFAVMAIVAAWAVVLSSPGGNAFVPMKPSGVIETVVWSGFVLGSFLTGYLFSVRMTSIRWCYWLTLHGSVPVSMFVVFTSVSGEGSVVASFLTVVLFSLHAGILTSNVQDSKWLASVLYMRHVNALLPSKGVNYLHWDRDGSRRILDSNRVHVRWSDQKQSIVCFFEGESVLLAHCAPVYINGSQLSSAYHYVMKLFNSMSPAWQDVMKHHRRELKHAEQRIAWLNLITVSIPDNPNDLLDGGARVPTGTSRLTIEESQYFFKWDHPTTDWETFCARAKAQVGPASELHITLEAENSSLTLHEVESTSSWFKQSTSLPPLLLLDLCSTRSYTAMMMVLYECSLSPDEQSSEIARQCIRSISFWFRNIKRDPLFKELSNMDGFTDVEVFLAVPDWHEWYTVLHSIMENPTERYLAAHDQLVKHAEHNINHAMLGSNGIIEQEIAETASTLMKTGRSSTRHSNTSSTRLQHDLVTMRTSKSAIVAFCTLRLVYLDYILNAGGKRT